MATKATAARKWKWWLGLGLVVLTVGLWGIWGRRPPPPPTPQPPAAAKSRMEGLSLTEIQDGDRRWVLSAQKADFRQEQMEISITGVGVEFFGPGEHIRVKADEGLFHTKTRVLTLKGQVEMQRGELLIKTGLAIYQPNERFLLAPEEVVLTEPNLKVRGKGLKVELAHKRLVLAQHQLTEIKPKTDWGLKP
ncbi:MAG: LPS export ABC transporter periplasmic protein LptC [Pseudomonadota bacterium]